MVETRSKYELLYDIAEIFGCFEDGGDEWVEENIDKDFQDIVGDILWTANDYYMDNVISKDELIEVNDIVVKLRYAE